MYNDAFSSGFTAWIASHGEPPAAQSRDEDYARDTVALGVEYLRHYALEPVQ